MSKAQSDQSGDGIPVNMEGWDWFKQQAEHAKNETQADTGLTAQELDYHFEKCFTTASGKIVLEHLQVLQDKYKDFDPELGFYNGAAFGFWRSGQKSIIQYLKIKSRGAKNNV